MSTDPNREKLISRARKLLRLAQSPEPFEAERAKVTADEWRAKHQITDAELTEEQARNGTPSHHYAGDIDPTSPWREIWAISAGRLQGSTPLKARGKLFYKDPNAAKAIAYYQRVIRDAEGHFDRSWQIHRLAAHFLGIYRLVFFSEMMSRIEARIKDAIDASEQATAVVNAQVAAEQHLEAARAAAAAHAAAAKAQSQSSQQSSQNSENKPKVQSRVKILDDLKAKLGDGPFVYKAIEQAIHKAKAAGVLAGNMIYLGDVHTTAGLLPALSSLNYEVRK